MANKKINNNGFDYVDLELPSKSLWATSNVGGDKPTDFGLYFQWGDKIGYASDQIGTEKGQKEFAADWSDYKMNPSGDGKTFTKYRTPLETLYLEDDAANNYMGGDWHIPSPEQFLELLYNTTREWTVKDDVKGILFTSKKNASKSIFFPAAGIAVNGEICGIGKYVDIWASKLSSEMIVGPSAGQEFSADSKFIGVYCKCIFAGLTLRAVIG